ncbi:MAG: tetratricopeptide repeat protein [Candidatus Obscuribacterales bacterium]|nr:tetratricopeptide repeat protein [Candidatus Obscuribacterales bacterium]
MMKKVIPSTIAVLVACWHFNPVDAAPTDSMLPSSGPYAVDRRIQLAYEHIKANRFESATPLLIAALRIDNNNITARRYLAYALLKSARPREALVHLGYVVQMTQPTALDLYVFAEAYRLTNSPEKAEQAYLESLKIDPHFYTARVGLINFYSETARAKLAISQCVAGEQLSADARTAAIFKALWAKIKSPAFEPGPIVSVGKAPGSEPESMVSNNDAVELDLMPSQVVCRM